MVSRPRLLYLGHNLPYPPHEGALIRSFHTVRLLSEAFDVSGIYFFRRGAASDDAARERALERMRALGTASAFRIPQEWNRARLVWDHARAALSGLPYTRWMHDSRPARDQLKRLLAEGRFDIIHVDSLDLLALLPMLPDAPIVLAHHNVESALLRRRATPERGLKRRYILRQADLVERIEHEWAPRVNLNVMVSSADEQLLRRLALGANTVVIPNGVDTSEFRPSEEEPRSDIVFVGGYSWFPNADGMQFFTESVLPLIQERLPGVRTTWVGRASPKHARAFGARGVEMTGYVDDIRPIVHDARCVIVPLRVGGGTRLKILDAWAMGKAVVSTRLGCEGLATRDGENILIADEPKAFAAKVLEVLSNQDLRHRLEAGARTAAVREYDWSVLGERMLTAYRTLIA